MEEWWRIMADDYGPTDWPYEFICWDCARARGGAWPKDHVATVHEGRCGYCGRVTT